MKRNIVSLLSLSVVLCLGFSACTNYKLNYSKEAKDWESALPEEAPSHTLYLIGDAGGILPDEDAPALRLLEKQLKNAPENSSVIFLGDNLYPNGMAPKKNEEERSQDEYRLKAQLDMLKDFNGNIFFVAGNHDWAGYGIDGLKRQRKFIEHFLDREDIWQPDCGCGDPKEIELSDDLVLILLDSEWWLADWDGEEKINQNCLAKSRDNFKLLFEDAIKGNREKNVLIAFHHPLYSNGPHGGRFRVKDHLFPLTNWKKNFWLPLPIVGSAYPLYRSAIGTRQDLAHPNYREFRDFVLGIARKNGQFIFASGHEHSLQYTEAAGQFFIGSGSGSKRSATRIGKGTQFAYGNYGFAQLNTYADGSVWLQFWADNEEGSGEVVFRKKIKEALPKSQEIAILDLPRLDPSLDSVRTPLVDNVPHRSGLGLALWGAHYREAYCAVLNYPVLNLESFQGGVLPLKQGGGYQTNSLRLQGAGNLQYTMRSIQKDPTRTVPYPLNRSEFVLDFISDAFNASHPISALPIPIMADHAGVYHTDPGIFYVPKQPALGVYNAAYGDALYLVEERPNGKHWGDHPNFGSPTDIISTTDVLDKIKDHPTHRIDYSSVVRSRIFDILLGDWDRHDDQWRWAKIEVEDTTFYRPIPRDRDQAFSNYDGFMYSVARMVSPAARPLKPYKEYDKSIHWSNFGSRRFDATFLSGASWDIWEEELHTIQSELTDDVIDRAFLRAWPDSIYLIDGPQVSATMKARRDKLDPMIRSFYEFHAKKEDVLGTNKRDLFEILRQENGNTQVRVYHLNKKGEKGRVIFERSFLKKETREISLYGLEGDDIFELSGEANKGILIRIIGGLGDDKVYDQARVKGWSAKTIVYDAKEEEIDIQQGPDTKVRLSDQPKFNTYNRLSRDYDFNFASFFPSIGYNPDDGVLIGLAPTFTHFGFKKSPFANKQSFSFKYAIATRGFEFKYTGQFTEALGKGNLRLDAIWRTPLYAFNFYGLGNDTENLEEEFGKDYNRVKQRYIAFQPAYVRDLNQAVSFGFGPSIESVRIDTSGDRFIGELAPEMNPEIFEGIQYLGVNFYFKMENLDDPVFPTGGFKFASSTGWKVSLNNSTQNFPYLQGAFSIYLRLEPQGRLVFATQIGGKHLFNNKFEFFQGATLGGIGPNSNFRGFRRERFTGRSAFYQNMDLRWKALASNNKVFPFSMGIFAGFDHGRVWLDGESSNTWHYSYGGGLWLSPLDLVDLKFALFRGDGKQNRFSFGGKFFF